MSKTYNLLYQCGNCFFQCVVAIPLGQEAPNFFRCPNCENKRSLKKSSKRFSDGADLWEPNGFTVKKVEE